MLKEEFMLEEEYEEEEEEDTRGWSSSVSCPHSWKKDRGRSFHCVSLCS